MSGYEERFIKKAATGSTRMSTFDTRVDHFEMENSIKISSCFTWTNSIWERICLEKSKECDLPPGRCFTSQESLLSHPPTCIPHSVLEVTHHFTKLNHILFRQKTHYSILSLLCLCLPCSTSPCRAARLPVSLSLWVCTAFALGSRGLVCINVIGKHIVQILAVAAKPFCGASQGKRSLHLQQLKPGRCCQAC